MSRTWSLTVQSSQSLLVWASCCGGASRRKAPATALAADGRSRYCLSHLSAIAFSDLFFLIFSLFKIPDWSVAPCCCTYFYFIVTFLYIASAVEQTPAGFIHIPISCGHILFVIYSLHFYFLFQRLAFWTKKINFLILTTSFLTTTL